MENKNQQNKSKEPHGRFYSPEFKEQVLNLLANSNQTARQIAQEFGIATELLYKWKRTSSKASTTLVSRDCLEEENRALRAELDRVRTQRDILKKTLGIVVEPPMSDIKGSRR